MLRLYSKITFTSKTDASVIVFDFVNEVQIDSSYENFTETAKITIPKTITNNGKPISTGTDAIFKRGDSVLIELGYYPNLTTAFRGYITKVNTKSPIIIDCEDEMFTLKNHIPANYSQKNPTLKHLLTAIVPSTVTFKTLLDVQMGTLRFSKVTTAEILDVIKKEYGLHSFFVNGVLKVGFESDASDTVTIPLTFEESIIDDSNIEFQRREDLRLKIKAISMNFTNTKIEKEVGDTDGTLKTFHYFNCSEADLVQFANIKLNTFKYTGFKGDLTTFGEPFIRHGDMVALTSIKYPDKDGTYQVKGVKRGFGMNVYRQVLELGIKTA